MKINVSFTVTLTTEERLAMGWALNPDSDVSDEIRASREQISEYFANRGLEKGRLELADVVRDYYAAKSRHFADLATGTVKQEQDDD